MTFRPSRLLLVLYATAALAVSASPVVQAKSSSYEALPAAGTIRVPRLVARSAPNPTAAAVRVLSEFRRDFRVQVVLAVGARDGSDGQPWYQIELPMRPNGRRAWVPASAVDVRTVTTRIVVHRGSRTLDLYRAGSLQYRTRVAVGAPHMETPLGHFYVTTRFVPDDAFLGAFALETSAYSKLSEWPGGGVVGIHGTSKPWLLGQAVSHGCIRVSNAAALALKRLAPVGTVVDVLA
jgi:lipoprotein-anchoring transpeptidase ErfK/SrfK